MAVNLGSVFSMATYINAVLAVPSSISAYTEDVVDQALHFVANYVGDSIATDNIEDKYQGVILDFAKADVIDLIQGQPGGEKIKLGELSIDDSGSTLSSKQYKILGETKLRALGRKIQFARSLS